MIDRKIGSRLALSVGSKGLKLGNRQESNL